MTGGRAALLNAAALGLSSALNFAALLLWLRLLDPHAFGTMALASAAALMLHALLFEWLRLAGARTLYAPDAPFGIDPARADALAFLMIAIGLGLGVSALALWWLGVSLFGIAPGWWPLVAALVFSEALLGIVTTLSRLRMRPWQFFLALVLRAALSIALGALLVESHSAAGVVAGVAGAQFLTAGLMMLCDPLWRARRPRRSGARAFWQLGHPLIAAAAFSYAAGIADRYLIDGALGTTAVGLYAAPADLLQKTLGLLLMAVNVSAYPALVRRYEEAGAQAAAQLLERNFVLMLGLGLPAAIGFALLAPGIARLMLGPAFAAAGATLLPWLAGAALLRLLTALHLSMAFQLSRRMGLMLLAPLATLAMLLPAGWIGMRVAGLTGMAVATLASQTIAFALCAIAARRSLPFRLLSRDTAKVLLAGAGLVSLLLPLRHYSTPGATIALAAVGAAAYLGLLLVLRVEALGMLIPALRRA